MVSPFSSLLLLSLKPTTKWGTSTWTSVCPADLDIPCMCQSRSPHFIIPFAVVNMIKWNSLVQILPIARQNKSCFLLKASRKSLMRYHLLKPARCSYCFQAATKKEKRDKAAVKKNRSWRSSWQVLANRMCCALQPTSLLTLWEKVSHVWEMN